MVPNLTLDQVFFIEIMQKTKYIMDGVNMDDSEIAKHSNGVNKLTLILAERISYLHQREIACLHWGTILHDIGKIGIPDCILHKKAPLSDFEMDCIKKHPIWGYQMARIVDMPEDITDIILYHHERFDGRGYPTGLKGKDIPLLARICSITDAFYAMISSRSYRDKLFYAEAISELELNRGKQFDPDIVDYFLELRPRIMAGEVC